MLNLNHYRRPRASRVVKASIVVAACVIGLVTWDFLGACGCGSASQAAGLHRVVRLNGLGMLCESIWGNATA